MSSIEIQQYRICSLFVQEVSKVCRNAVRLAASEGENGAYLCPLSSQIEKVCFDFDQVSKQAIEQQTRDLVGAIQRDSLAIAHATDSVYHQELNVTAPCRSILFKHTGVFATTSVLQNEVEQLLMTMPSI